MPDDYVLDLEKRLNALRDCKAEKQSVWSDSASRAVNSRYLEPLDVAATKQLEALKAQRESLVEADTCWNQFEELRKGLGEAILEISDDCPAVDNLIRSADGYSELARRREDESKEAIQMVEDLLSQLQRLTK